LRVFGPPPELLELSVLLADSCVVLSFFGTLPLSVRDDVDLFFFMMYEGFLRTLSEFAAEPFSPPFLSGPLFRAPAPSLLECRLPPGPSVGA